MLSPDDLTLSTDAILALVSFGLPVAVLVIVCGIAWAVSPSLASGRA